MSDITTEKPVHLHIYERSRSNKEVYRCLDPDCTHYSRRELIEGKRASCYKCHEPFILSWTQLRNAHPVCLKCSKSKKAEQFKEVSSVLESLFELKGDENTDVGH